MNGLGGANISTCTAIDAFIRINFIDVAFTYCFRRAFSNASATCTAIITNYISHKEIIYSFMGPNLIL